ncbi:MAG: FG-GAP-like repeat-containing protein [Streptomyces sp.]|uniref:FG-GAP-like repeat-containing protein n=1 Tax=Streptomyces sp. TaxID=1931 RepID=UPI003D6BE09B
MSAVAVALGAAVAGTLACSAGAAEPGDTGSGGERPAQARSAAAQAQQIREDFNGDGYNDLAVGAPGNADFTGYLSIVYGSASGLDPATRTVIDQNTPGVPDTAEPGDYFGDTLAARDLDGDGITDLAVLSRGETTEAPRGEGSVTLLWGAKAGLSGKDAALLRPGQGEQVFGLGSNLTGGDFNGDGDQDLLMWRGGDGGHSVLRGPFTRTGTWAGEQKVELTQGDSEVMSVVAGDVTGDGADDLAVLESMEEMARPGDFFTGGKNGLRHSSTLPHGATGAIGDFDKDGYGDLAYRAVPGGVVENLPYDSGTVKVRYGTASGPGQRTATFTQATPGVPGANEKADQFGGTLAAGDVTGDGYADLAAGVPFEAIGDKKEAGSFVLLKGGAKGLTGTGAQAMSQDFAAVPGVAEASDRFGGAVRLLDFGKDAKADLAVSAPGENEKNGAAWYFPGGAKGLTTSGVRSFAPGDVGAPAAAAGFGRTFGGSVYAPLWGQDF